LKNIENVDLNYGEKGVLGVIKKMTNEFSNPENPYIVMVLKNISER